jgi:glutamine cyclotransferase
MRNKKLLLKTVLFAGMNGLLFIACEEAEKRQDPALKAPDQTKTTPVLPYKLINTFPHDTVSFTEGFLFHEGKLYESIAGMDYLPATESAFGILDLQTGKLDVKVKLDKSIYFGEGIVVLNGKIYQLTYKNQTGFIYDAKTYKKTGQFSFQNKEGWGLTTDGKHLIMSDGTYNLTYLDPDNQNVIKVLAVTEKGYGVDHLNELEYINGFLYANVWMTNNIVKIDPETGEVLAKVELDELNVNAKRKYVRSLEMNGIAYDSLTDRILVTGKLWPYVYELQFPH